MLKLELDLKCKASSAVEEIPELDRVNQLPRHRQELVI